MPQHEPESIRWHGDHKEAEDYLPAHQQKRAYISFLLWRISNVEDSARWMCVKQPPHQEMPDLLFLGVWKLRSYKMSAAEPHVVGHLYVQPPMCGEEKLLSECSASQEQMSTTHRGSSAQQCLRARLVGSRIRSHPEVYLQVVPTQALSSLLQKRKSLDKVKGEIIVIAGIGAYFWFVYLHILSKRRQNIIFMNSMLSFGIDTNECKALSPSCLYHQIN